MTYYQGNRRPTSTRKMALALAVAATTMFGAGTTWGPQAAFAQTVSLELAPLSVLNELESDWQRKNNALQTAINAIEAHRAASEDVRATVAAQKAKIDGAKNGLSAAVVKLTEAKNRLGQVDTSNEDPKGEELSQELIQAQTELNRVISASEKSQQEKEELKTEHDRLRSTVGELKKAVSAAKAAVSAAEVYVDAVKSAQQVLADNDTGGSDSLQNDFYAEAVKQTEVARKSAEVAQKALTATRERQTQVAERLLQIDELLKSAKQAEAAAYEKFANADQTFKNHQAAIKAERDARDALIAQINAERDLAEEQLQAQKEILQAETLAMQDIAAQEQAATNKMDDLQSDLDQAEAAFDSATQALREAQHTRAVQSAAIVADINSQMTMKLRDMVPGADATTASARLILPASTLFSRNSAKIRNTDAINLPAIAEQVREYAGRVPEGIDWMVRVDNYAPGGSDESWFLSQNRALSVAQSLIANGNFDGPEISANGLVKAKPVSDATAAGWVEIVLTTR